MLGRLAAFGAAAIVWLVFLSPTGVGGPVGLVWVSGTSMEPTMHTGDLAVLYERSDYSVGDTVAFEIPGGGTVIHRIIEETDEGYRFQGDNRDFADPWTLTDDDIIGRLVTHVPRAGMVMTWLGRPIVMAALVAMLVLLHTTRSRKVPTAANDVTEYALAGAGLGTVRRALRHSTSRPCETHRLPRRTRPVWRTPLGRTSAPI